jgi:hypothetical protein
VNARDQRLVDLGFKVKTKKGTKVLVGKHAKRVASLVTKQQQP